MALRLGPAQRREWRQFRLLSRDSVRKLLNAAMLSRDGDPALFALWMLAVFTTPPTMFAFGQMLRYGMLQTAAADVVLNVALTHRMFFVLYGMLATALVAALLWEALFPDQTDQEILGALPVRPRTAAAARLVAAVGVACGFGLVLGAPSAFMFAVVSTTHAVLGFLPTVFIAHLAATLGGSLFVFTSLLLVRGLVTLAISAAAAARLATLLQLVTVITIVEVFVYLPAVLPALVGAMLEGDGWMRALPPVWFAALYSWMVGVDMPVLGGHAGLGALMLLLVVGAVLPVYLVPARLVARRTLESRGEQRAGTLTAVTTAVRRALALTPLVGSLFAFVITSLLRSRRHLLIVVTYAGLGLAVGVVSVLTASLRGRWNPSIPDDAILTLPLVMIFVLTVGFRAAFAIPIEIDANWMFRVLPPGVRSVADASRAVLLTLAVCPVVATFTVVTLLLGWKGESVALVLLFDTAMGLLLVEAALHEWVKIPLTCAHELGGQAVKTRWLVFIATLYIFAFRGADVQASVLESGRSSLTYFGTVVLAALVLAWWHSRRSRALTVQFDEADTDAPQTLSLSEALR